MNIICNNCVGARLYEVTKQQFPNPFMWMTIWYEDFIKLINDYDNLDFNNPIFELENYNDNENKSILVTLNNGVKLHYIHYIQDESKYEPIKELNTNILYKDILIYAKKKWFNRLNRSKEEPTFLFSFNYMNPSQESYKVILNKLLTIKNKKLIILVHDEIIIDKEVSPNINIIHCNNDIMELNGGALANALKNMIFINNE